MIKIDKTEYARQMRENAIVENGFIKVSEELWLQIADVVEGKQLNNGWIPCSERLPMECGYYQVSCRGGNVHMDLYMNDKWDNEYCYDILAWQNRIKPYEVPNET